MIAMSKRKLGIFAVVTVGLLLLAGFIYLVMSGNFDRPKGAPEDNLAEPNREAGIDLP